MASKFQLGSRSHVAANRVPSGLADNQKRSPREQKEVSMFSRFFQFSRFTRSHVPGAVARSALRLAALAAAGIAGTAMASTYTYTPNNAATDTWSAGTDWSAKPVSGATTTLTFVGNNTTILANGLTNINTDDIGGAFQAGVINLQGTGPASGAATINIAAASGSSLNLVAPAANSIVAYLNANAGTAGLTYNVSAPVSLTAFAAGDAVEFAGTGTATFDFSGGITTTNNAALLVASSSAPTITLSGSVASTVQGLAVEGGARLNANANLDVTGVNSTLTIKGGFSVNSGVMTQDNNATVNLGTVGSLTNYVWAAFIGVGGPGNNGTYNLDSGTLNVNVSSLYGGLRIGQSTGVTGTLNVNGGTLNNYVENASTPTADVLGTIGLAVAGGSTATVNQNAGVVNTGQVSMVGATSATLSTTAAYNLNGGTLATGQVNMHTTGSGATATFNFNGGTLQANATSATFMQGLTAANVQAGGAVLDTNGFNDTIAQLLMHDPALGSTPDGGLTKQGSGILTLSGANTYTGTTAVAAGTLKLGVASAVADSSRIDVQSGATLDVSALTSGFTVGASQTLEGVGTVSTGGHTLTINGTVKPGDAAMGTLTIDPASMVFSAGSTLSIDAVGASSDLLAVDGTLNLSGTGDTLDFVGTPTAGLYTIVTYSGTLTGTFANLNLLGYSINYGTGSNSSITLSRVPEPATLGLLALGGLGILASGRRQRRA